jgi:hypothetical protein
MTRRRDHCQFLLLIALVMFLISGCASQGAKRLPADRFDYNAALSISGVEQMLLNIVRSRYQEMPVFLKVGSVVAQYSYERSARVGYLREFIGYNFSSTSDTASSSVNVGYSEFPTITYVPIQGEAFAKHLYSEVAAELFFGAANSGWSIDLLMLIGIEQLGSLKNMTFGEVRSEEQRATDIENLERFARAIKLLFILSDEHLIEVIQVVSDKKNGAKTEQFLVFTPEVPEDLRPLVTEFRQLLGISSGNRFKITTHIHQSGTDEITIQTRSVMAMMKYMARGVEIPAAHIEAGWVIDYGLQTREGKKRLFPFRMQASTNRPENAVYAVRYQDYWYSVDQADIVSKRSLEHLMIFFQLQAPVSKGSAPLLTLPTR